MIRTSAFVVALGSVSCFVVAVAGCSASPSAVAATHEALRGDGAGDDAVSPAGPAGAVGLAVEVENGVGTPLRLRAGQRVWVDQIDVRAFLDRNVDEGVDGLAASGDFAGAPWIGSRMIEAEPQPIPNFDGTFVQRRFYRNALWMEAPSWFVLSQLDAGGHEVGSPILLSAGSDFTRRSSDDFFVRRMRALQWVNDCPTLPACAGATHFQEEALIELRNSMAPWRTFALDPRTTALALKWTMKPGSWTIPVTQEANPPTGTASPSTSAPLTPRPARMAPTRRAAPSSSRSTLRDGAGNRLHPPGSLPKYLEVIFGAEQSRHPVLPRLLRSDHDVLPAQAPRAAAACADFIGTGAEHPAHPLAWSTSTTVLGPNDTDLVASIATDGVYGELRAFPTGNKLFGGAFDPTHAAWFEPVRDTWSSTFPPTRRPAPTW